MTNDEMTIMTNHPFGTFSHHGSAFSSCPASRNNISSSPSRAVNMTPTGRFSASPVKDCSVQYNGTDIDGCPVIFANAVQGIQLYIFSTIGSI